MKQLLVIFLLSLYCVGCGSDSDSKSKLQPASGQKSERAIAAQLNITVLLDLSDRISTKKNPEKPEHFQRDIAVIEHLSKIFVKDMEKRGTFMSKGKIKVIFSPKPQDPNINLFAEKLSVDLSSMDVKQKKEIHDHIVATFAENLNKIYAATIAESKWIGSDIWRFFKNDVKDYCIERDSNYRNILVILTDGYIYHEDSKDKMGNRFAYLLPENINSLGLRNNSEWEKVIADKDFGLIAKRNDLQNLEVLVLEVSPSRNYKNDEDVIKAVLAKWFQEMKVKRFGIYNSDLPEYTKQRVNDFIAE
ncbi:MAG: hypothetical protein ABIV51_12045 [Saprospiraceae bacterium]